MSTLVLIWGVVAFCGFTLALIPCLGWLNWLNIPFSLAGALISIIAMARAHSDKKSPVRPIVGLILCAIAASVGLLRLLLGGGLL